MGTTYDIRPTFSNQSSINASDVSDARGTITIFANWPHELTFYVVSIYNNYS